MVVICVIGMLKVNAQQKTIPFYNSEITVDGKFEEEVWGKLSEFTGFYNYEPTDVGIAANQTSVKIFHNGKSIFIRAIYQDSTEKLQVGSLKRDDVLKSVIRSDAFVVILDVQNQKQSAYYFAVNASGAITDGIVERNGSGFNLNANWNTVWKAKTSSSGKLKHYEMEIPLKALSFSKENAFFGVQFYVRDIKQGAWTVLTNIKRNYPLYDLNFTEVCRVENLPEKSTSRFTLTPSVTSYYQEELEGEVSKGINPSLDLQYNISSSMRLDATINPDFSQIEIDQQVTNLTRFGIYLPERRNFFLENSDLFSNLGTNDVKPFYSRKIGADSDIQFGVKMSGNIAPKTRLGILNTQTEKGEDVAAQNYGVFVAEQKISKNFTTTGYLINRQEMNRFERKESFNRVPGINLNFKSSDKKWNGLLNYGKSINDDISKKNSLYNASLWYTKRGSEWSASVKSVGKNYITDAGFNPRLYHYDAEKEEEVREGYLHTKIVGILNHYPDQSTKVNAYRYFFGVANLYWDQNGRLSQGKYYYNTALFLKNNSSFYMNVNYDYINLKYAFDPLQNEQAIEPGEYRFAKMRVGYNSPFNKKVYFRTSVEHGQYYNGRNSGVRATVSYRLLPVANLEISYQMNSIDLNELGEEVFHLTRFTGEVFFNNRLNWTTYLQYSNQFDQFNVNSRLQWEYRPLSYVYLVVTDNLTQKFARKDWGVALKFNYRFDF